MDIPKKTKRSAPIKKQLKNDLLPVIAGNATIKELFYFISHH